MREALRHPAGMLLLVAASVAAAQENPAARDEMVTGQAQDNAAPQLEEIVVTATRRAKNVAKVPVAVSEVEGKTLETAVLRDTQALQMAVPSLVVTVSGNENAGSVIRIRGVGTSGGNAGFESSVGVFVDGVYLPRPSLALTDLVDVERIEVLRGPQGTLFGKNTSVGAIHILTRAPSFEPHFEVGASAGNFGAYIARTSFGGPVGDTIAVRVAGQYNVRDGYIHNLVDGENYNDRDRYTLRGQVLFEPTTDLSLRLIADTIRKDERCCAAPYSLNGPIAERVADMGGTVFEPPAEYTVAFDYPLFSEAEESSASMHLNWDAGPVQLQGLVSYQEGSGAGSSDGDYSDLDVAYIPFSDSTIRIRTAELSLHGLLGPVDWLVGVYGSDEDIAIAAATLLGDDAAQLATGVPVIFDALYPGGTGQQLTTARQDAKSWSVFTHNVVDLAAGFDLTFGARYLHEAKEGGGQTTSDSPSCVFLNLPPDLRPVPPLLCGADPYTARYEDERLTGTVALGKSFGPVSYLYASYSSGFKSGGVNLTPPSTRDDDPDDDYVPPTTFRPETVDAYEIGLRLPLFGRGLLTRTTLFWMDIEDFQLNAYDGVNFTVSNAAAVRSRGVEFEGTLLVFDDLVLTGGFTYADAKYVEGAQVSTDSNVAGKRLTNAPRWVGQISARYETALPWWKADVFGTLAARHQGNVNTGVDLDAEKEQQAYTLINARLGLRFPRNLEVSVWGANLTDEFYRLIIFDSVAQAGSYNGYVGLPRTYGIEFLKRF